MTIIVNDNFAGPDANPILRWTPIPAYSTVQQVSHRAEGSTFNGYNQVYDAINSYPADQFSRITSGLWNTAAGGDLIGCIVRCTPAAGSYALWQAQRALTGSKLEIFSSLGIIVASPTITLNVAGAPGDIFELDVQGQTYSCYHTPVSTGVQYLAGAYTDPSATLVSGSAGFEIFPSNVSLTNLTNVTTGTPNPQIPVAYAII